MKYSLEEQNKLDELQERAEFPEEQMEEGEEIRGLMGDRIPIEALNPENDPNITVPEVSMTCGTMEDCLYDRESGIRITRTIWTLCPRIVC